MIVQDGRAGVKRARAFTMHTAAILDSSAALISPLAVPLCQPDDFRVKRLADMPVQMLRTMGKTRSRSRGKQVSGLVDDFEDEALAVTLDAETFVGEFIARSATLPQDESAVPRGGVVPL